MKLKQLAQIMLISCSMLTLAACSTTHRGATDGDDNAAMAEADADGAQAAGAGEGSDFGGGAGGRGAKQGLQQRTYYFDYDKSDVRSEYLPAIYANANYLLTHSNARITVEGHTDPRGSREYNVALAERRANAVAEILRSKGVNPRQIRVVSYGAERLASPGRSEHDFQLDRRAVIVYLQR